MLHFKNLPLKETFDFLDDPYSWIVTEKFDGMRIGVLLDDNEDITIYDLYHKNQKYTLENFSELFDDINFLHLQIEEMNRTFKALKELLLENKIINKMVTVEVLANVFSNKVFYIKNTAEYYFILLETLEADSDSPANSLFCLHDLMHDNNHTIKSMLEFVLKKHEKTISELKEFVNSQIIKINRKFSLELTIENITTIPLNKKPKSDWNKDIFSSFKAEINRIREYCSTLKNKIQSDLERFVVGPEKGSFSDIIEGLVFSKNNTTFKVVNERFYKHTIPVFYYKDLYKNAIVKFKTYLREIFDTKLVDLDSIRENILYKAEITKEDISKIHFPPNNEKSNAISKAKLRANNFIQKILDEINNSIAEDKIYSDIKKRFEKFL